MAKVQRGTITATPSWACCWKHLRPYFKRMYWKAERAAFKRQLKA